MKDQNIYFELDLMQIFKALWQKIWAIILAAVIGALAAFFAATFVISPKYEAETMMYVNNSSFSVNNASFSITSSEISAAQSLVDTYIVILKSRSTLGKIINKSGVEYSYEELRGMITAAPVDSTEVFSVVVTSKDPKESELIANSIAEVLPDRIAEIVDGSSVRIVDYAVVPSSKASPNITLYTAIGMVFFAIIACVIIIIRMLTDCVIRDEDYLLQTYDLPVLAVIPSLYTQGGSNYYYSNEYSRERR